MRMASIIVWLYGFHKPQMLLKKIRLPILLGSCLALFVGPLHAGAQAPPPANVPPSLFSGQPYPGFMYFNAPCGIYFDALGNMTPPSWIGSLPGGNSPLIEQCAVQNSLIGDDTALATPASTQPTQDIPLAISETTVNGSMLFNFLVEYRDTTDTYFNGKFDAEIDIPYDASLCRSLPPGPVFPDGLQSYSTIPLPCEIVIPTQYISAQAAGHQIGWTLYNVVSETVYGPKSPVPPNTPSALIQSTGKTVLTDISVPYQTEISSTVVRVGMRFSEGYYKVMPISFACTPGSGSAACQPPGAGNPSSLGPEYSGAMQGEWVWSQPFTVQVQPAALVQYSFLPAFILYQPPGDQSSASFQMLSSYSQQYTTGATVSLTNSTEFDNKTMSDDSFGGKENLSTYLSDNFAVTNNSVWDNDIKQAMGTAYGSSVNSLFASSLTQINSTPKLPTNATPEASLSFYQQPFWSDEIYFLVHPQFAIWNYPNGPIAAPLGSAAVLEADVARLSTCAGSYGFVTGSSNPLKEQYSLLINKISQVFSVTLQSSDCINLLQLDPFWLALSQAPTPPMGIPLFKGSQPLSNAPETFTSAQASTFTSVMSFTQTFNTSITASETNTIGGSSGINFLVFALGFGSSYTNSSINGQQFQIQLSTSQSSATEAGLTSSITLQDCPAVNGTDSCSTAENPVPVMIFQDSRFGTMMAETPTLSIPFPWPKVTVNLPSGPIAPCFPCGFRIDHGLAFGQLTPQMDQSFDPSLIKSVNLTNQVKRVRLPLELISKEPGIVSMLPVASSLQPPVPQNLELDLEKISTTFPNATKVIKPPIGRVYPSSGVVKIGGEADRVLLLPKK